jgi:hypothetical protein
MFGRPAQSRLLPMSVPFRFFGAAVAFHAAAWGVLLAHAGELPAFAGGLGPVFAALHLATLGVLAMAAAGATLQLFPVATRQSVRSVGAAKLAWWLLVPGIALFGGGAWAYDPRLTAFGAIPVSAALAIYGWLLYRNLRGARGMPVVVAHGWAALGCLALFLLSGIALVASYEHGLALDHAAFRTAHLALAAYGFMGLLAIGLSQLLLPMFAVAPPPSRRWAYAVLAAACLALALAVAGFPAIGASLGVAAALGHIVALERALRSRLRRELDPAFALVRLSWAFLVASLAFGALLAAGAAPPRAAALFGVLLVPGWLLTFLFAVLQRIVPFLASVHASGARPSGLSAQAPLAAHRALHVAALAGLAAGVIADSAWLARAGAAAGLAGAAAFAVFFIAVLLRVRRHGVRSPHQPAAA